MSMPRKRVVDCVSVGVPCKKKPKGGIETVIFIIHDFRNARNDEGKDFITSPTLKALGLKWKIEYYPEDDDDRDKIGIFVHSLNKDNVAVSFKIRCKDVEINMSNCPFTSDVHTWGSRVLDRSVIEEYLEEDGSFRIEVDFRKDTEVWYPKILEQHDILVDLYHDARSETADAVFCVGENEYHVHKSILNLRCKKLYEIAKEYDDDNGAPIPIDSTRGEIFKSLLDFAYNVIPEINDSNIAKELLIAADCYECIQLKLYVESVMVDKLITPENAAELFLFADSHSCPLLREKAISVFVSDASKVKKAEEWSTIKESNMFINEFLEAVTSEGECTDTVTTLREQLEEVNLELDGSFEVLAERLEAFCRKDSEKEEDSKEEEEEERTN